MNRFFRATLAAVAVLAIASASAAGRSLDAQALREFGGTYKLDCRNNASAKVTVFANAMVFLDGSNRVASNSVEPGYSFFQPNPAPKGFVASLLNTGPGGHEMLWQVYRDATGQYLVFEDADARSAAVITRAVAKKKLWLCAGNAVARPAVAAAAAPVPAAVPAATPARRLALDEVTASGLLQDRKARAAYFKALGPLRSEAWLARLDGPSVENRWVTIAGAKYLLASACKTHDCHDFNTVLLYSPEQDKLVGAVYRAGKATLIGAPTPAMAKELGRLWRQEYRRG